LTLPSAKKNHLPRLRPDFPPARRVAGIRWTATKPGTAQLVIPLGFPLENADLTPKNED